MDYPSIESCLLSFSLFLEKQGRPKAIRWITPSEIIYFDNHFYIINKDFKCNDLIFESAYLTAKNCNIGIKISYCAQDDNFSYCRFYVPEDEDDRDRIMINNTPKFACNNKTISAKFVHNNLFLLLLKSLKFLKWNNSIILNDMFLEHRKL